MKRFAFLFISNILICICGCNSSVKHVDTKSENSNSTVSDSSSLISSIQSHVAKIDGIKKWTKVVEEELENSTEGGMASYYYNDSKLEKIVVQNYGETFQNSLSYYVVNDELVCYSEENLIYNRPIYYDEEAMVENEDTTYFDIEKSKKTKYVYYFDKGKCIHQTVSGSVQEFEKDSDLSQSIYQKFLDLKK